MNKEILETFIKVSQDFIGNSNSLHKLGTKSKQLENASTNQILQTLNLKNKEVIYTSGRCESNNFRKHRWHNIIAIKKFITWNKNNKTYQQ